MQSLALSYEVHGIHLNWGHPFAEVIPQVAHILKLKSYPEGWANVRLRGSDIFDLKCAQMEIRAPFEDRQVMQVIYELAPITVVNEQGLHSRFIDRLETHFGSPIKSESFYNKQDWRSGLSQSSVVHSATWEFGKVRYSLSVYGGTRTNDGGECAAGLYVNYIDEKTAAAPLKQKMEAFAKQVDGFIGGTQIHKFKLQNKQHKFFVSHYGNKITDEAKHDYDLRFAQMCLYRQNAMPTPKTIADGLDEDQTAVYRIAELQKTFVSTKWDTTFIADFDTVKPIFFEVHPARGPGGRELEINKLLLSDLGGNSLLDMAQWIERLSGVKTTMLERADD